MKQKINSPVADENKEKEIEAAPVHPKSPEAGIRYEDKNFVDTSKSVWNYSLLYDDDITTFQHGTNYGLYKKFGSKRTTVLGREGYHFTVWAPNATQVSVIGNFNQWNTHSHLLQPRWDNSGIWEGFIP